MQTFISGSKTNSRGVAILIKNNFEYKIHDIQRDLDGNILILDLNIASISVRLINIYAPNLDTPDFFQNLSEIIEQNKQDYLVICGDFNLVMNPNLDSYNYVSINNPKSRNLALQILETYNLTDVFRYMHPDTKRYTWRWKNPVKQARLDYFIYSIRLFTDIVTSCKINLGYRSDHSILELNVKINTFQWGKGLWKFNCSLLKDETYIEMINKAIKDIKIEYAVPVYTYEYLNADNDWDIQFTIDDNLLLEMLLLKI